LETPGQQIRQLGEVDRRAPRLVFGQPIVDAAGGLKHL